MKVMRVNEYITNNWSKTLRDGDVKKDGYIPLPKPFNVPSLDDRFDSLFYWDTYFLNLGLLADGLFEQAKNNLENMAYLIEKLGFMPNSNRLIYHSQPPLFTRGVYDLYLYTQDKQLAISFLSTMKKEYTFFMEKRTTPVGLNRYDCTLSAEELKKYYGYFSKRMNMEFSEECEQIAFTRRLFGICESGWDSTSRFHREGKTFATDEFAPIDLNSILYDMERKIAEISSWAGDMQTAEEYAEYARARKDLINRYLFEDTTKLYYDYNFERKEVSSLFSAASFFPYAFGLSTDKEGIRNALEKLECEHGISACEKGRGNGWQWDYPMMWPSNVWAAFEALKNCGLKDEAKRVAKKYIESIEETFAKTGTLWEKYDAETGYSGFNKKEGNASPMLGWTAGVYKHLIMELKKL